MSNKTHEVLKQVYENQELPEEITWYDDFQKHDRNAIEKYVRDLHKFMEGEDSSATDFIYIPAPSINSPQLESH